MCVMNREVKELERKHAEEVILKRTTTSGNGTSKDSDALQAAESLIIFSNVKKWTKEKLEKAKQVITKEEVAKCLVELTVIPKDLPTIYDKRSN